MATYASYKKLDGGTFAASTISASSLNASGLDTWNVKWVYGTPNFCSPGCCCLWTVPTGVRRARFELWGAGGNGSGTCSTSRCQNYRGAGGGYYNTKTIDVCPGWTYTVCAAGVYPCLSIECNGCTGCSSFVNGCNLSNFCAIGGYTGQGFDGWSNNEFSYFTCCIGPTSFDGDFGMGNHAGASWRPKGEFCHCHGKWSIPTAAPFIGTNVYQTLNFCWMRCGCWTVPYGHGGQNAMSTYCGGNSCCGQGGTGGPGLVKITYV